MYPLALRTCGWDIYDAHEWLDRMLREEERRAAEAGGVYDRPDGFACPARSFEGRERVGSTGGTFPRAAATDGMSWAGLSTTAPWTVKTARWDEAEAASGPPRAPLQFLRRRTRSDRGGRAGPRRTGSSFETCRTRSRTSIRSSWRTRCTALRPRGTWTGRRRGSTRSTPRGGTRYSAADAAAAAAAAAAGGESKRRRR